MRRNRCVAVAIVTVIAAGGWSVWHRWSNSTTPISVDELARRVAASTTTTTTTTSTSETTIDPTTTAVAAPPLPRPGVYAFETEGSERLDVLDGIERTYPAETGIAVSATACGVDLSWQPYVERTYTISLCTIANEIHVTGYANRYEFYGNEEQRRLACQPPNLWQPEAAIGFETECTGDGISEQRHTTAGTATLTVDGQQRAVTHLVVDARTTGSTEGSTHEELWIDAATGMLLRLERVVSNASATAVGSAHYDETVTLSLSTFSPVGAHAGLRDRREH